VKPWVRLLHLLWDGDAVSLLKPAGNSHHYNTLLAWRLRSVFIIALHVLLHG
jgi:hypothetical protein